MKNQDSKLTKENKTVLAGLETKYKSLQKDTEIQKQQGKINEQRIKHNYLFGCFSVIGLLLL